MRWSFELVYWHDALARVVDRAGQHADRWQQNQQNQSILRRSAQQEEPHADRVSYQ